MWSTNSAPSGWLLCDGTSVLTASYAALFAVIGYTFGGSGGSFTLPDFRNRFPVGSGDSYAIAGTGGSANAVVVSHTHTATSTVTDPGHVHGPGAGSAFLGLPNQGAGGRTDGFQASNFTNTASSSTGITVATTNASTGVSDTNANLPPYLGIRFIIKT
jgi:microcystin-dependent protein